MRRISLTLFLTLAWFTFFGQTEFITTWTTDNLGSSNDNSITIPTNSSYTYSYDVDWDNNGTWDSLNVTGDITHDFGSPGTYTIAIRGDFPAIYFNNSGDCRKIESVDQWGTIAWQSFERSFNNCDSLRIPASDAPDLSNVSSMAYIFANTYLFNDSLNHWNVSTITDMTYMFSGAVAFDQDLSSWDMSNVLDVRRMFNSASSFNQDLNDWDLSSVLNSEHMFRRANAFNPDTLIWDLSSDTTASQMFNKMALFNPDTLSLDLSSAKDLSGLFYDSPKFNSPTHLTLGNAEDMSYMFEYCYDFNQDISSWDVSTVTIMEEMFYDAYSFNQDLSNWKVSNVSNMIYLFSGTAFDQDIGDWDISSLTDADEMFYDVTLSTENYDSLLIGWLKTAPTGAIPFYGGDSKYCNAGWARDSLIAKGWEIDDDGYEITCDVESFRTTWTTDNPGTSDDNSITIPTNSSYTYNYDIDWDSDGEFDTTGVTGDITHDFGSPGTYTISIRGDFPAIYFNNIGDCRKIESVDQWGTIAWQSFEQSFNNCDSLNIFASDTPDLSNVSSMAYMFANTHEFNDSLNHWNVSAVKDMSYLFSYARSFDHDLSAWDMSNVTDVNYMFRNANTFNQDLNDWDLSSVLNSEYMFRRANAFNPDTLIWDLSSDTTASRMFNDMALFNPDTLSLDLSSAKDLSGLFYDSPKFNSPTHLTLGNAEDMSYMFEYCYDFNQDISSWDVSTVTVMEEMFYDAYSFNQDLSNWKVSNVSNMIYLFSGTAFDQDIGDWDVSSLADADDMFDGVSLSTENYDSLLIGWLKTAPTGTIPFYGGNSKYCSAGWARDSLIAKGWEIEDDGPDGSCNPNTFISTWTTDNSGTSDDKSITISTNSAYTYNYDIDWNFDGEFDTTGVTGDITHDFGSSGTYTIAIRGDFPAIYFNNNEDRQKIIDVSQWGDSVKWESFEYAFYGCSNFRISATDAPDLSNCTSMKGAFRNARVLNDTINHWNVITIQDLSETFRGAYDFNTPLNSWNISNDTTLHETFRSASDFNQNLNNWNVSQVKDMTGTFESTNSFNSNISSWITSQVTNMDYMFYDSEFFNQDISGWDVGNVTTMVEMFLEAEAFNQDIGEWNTENVTDMYGMFYDAISFDQNLGDWNVENVSDMANMFKYATLSTANYDSLLIGWNSQNLQKGLGFHGGYSTYCLATSERDTMTNILYDNWTITDGGRFCLSEHFVSTWQTDNNGAVDSTSVTIPINSNYTYNYNVDWDNDGIWDDLNVTGSISHNFIYVGTYTIRIKGDFPAIYFNNGGDRKKIIDVSQWGDSIQWESFESAFHGCINLDFSAIDAPDLTNCNNMHQAFKNAKLLNASIDHWNVSTIDTMSSTFEDCQIFDQSLNSWDVSSVRTMQNMFEGASVFNGNITDWETDSLRDMADMFYGCDFFNQNIGGWNVSKVNTMYGAFLDCLAFNQDIGSWDVGEVTDMSEMFYDCPDFNQDLRNWDVSQVSDMSSMFYNCTDFDQNLGDWDVSNVSDMTSMFYGVTLSTSNYDSTLIGWNSQNLQYGVKFNGGNSTYCLAGLARDTISNMLYDNWNISDGGEDCNTYPIELLDFQADRVGERVQLRWKTALELNNDYFSIERSLNSEQWEELDTLKGAGTSATISSYQYWDNAPPMTQIYYRLKQVDFDGDYNYSPIIMISFEAGEWNPTVSPNPGLRDFKINLTKEISVLRFNLINSLGQKVISQTHENVSKINFQIDEAEGIYYAILIDQEGKKIILKIMKQ